MSMNHALEVVRLFVAGGLLGAAALNTLGAYVGFGLGLTEIQQGMIGATIGAIGFTAWLKGLHAI